MVFLGYVLNEKGSSKKMRTELVVDQVRELGQWFALTASQGVAQVAIIEPADQLNDNAANALLKTLEEPSSNRYLLLVTDNPGRLPATVLSRCQRLEFRIPEPAVARQWLRDRGIADADACEALDAARGHPGLAAEWLAQGGLALRQEVKSDLEQIAAGRGSPVTTAQRWLADDSADLRLRFAADLALEAGKRQSAGMGRIGDWFNAVGRCRMQLRAPLRHDLVLAGLLHEWGNMFRRAG